MDDYVMVPIPAELEEQVRIFLMQTDMRATANRETTGVEANSVAEMLKSLNPLCRQALVALADGTVSQQHLSIADLARNLHWSPHQALGVVQELQELVWQVFGPKIALVSGTGGATGSVDWGAREVIIWMELALAVEAAEELLASEP